MQASEVKETLEKALLIVRSLDTPLTDRQRRVFTLLFRDTRTNLRAGHVSKDNEQHVLRIALSVIREFGGSNA